MLVCSDTHTGSGGAFNCAARGVGGPDIIYAAIKAETWFRVYPTIRYDIEGKLAPGVTAKDVFLYLANTYGDHAGHNIEFGGPGMGGLRIDARRTIAAMCTELNAEFAIFEADDVVLELRADAQSRAVHADRSRRRRRAMPRGARSTSARSKSWWRSPIRF